MESNSDLDDDKESPPAGAAPTPALSPDRGFSCCALYAFSFGNKAVNKPP